MSSGGMYNSKFPAWELVRARVRVRVSVRVRVRARVRVSDTHTPMLLPCRAVGRVPNQLIDSAAGALVEVRE